MDTFIWGTIMCWINLPYLFIWSLLLVQGILLGARGDKGHKECAPCSAVACCPFEEMRCTQITIQWNLVSQP